MRRIIALATVLLATAGAAPAWAHQEISPASVPIGRPAFLILSAANEKQVDLTRVTMTPPSGRQFGHATKDPAGWSANLSHTQITWTGGAVRPSRFEQFGFDVEPIGQPGPVSFKVVFGYADGTTSEADVSVNAVAAGDQPVVTSPGSTTATTVHDDDHEETPDAAPVASDGDSDDGSGLATAALVVAAIALGTSVTSAVMARRRGAGPANPPSPSTASGGQDW